MSVRYFRELEKNPNFFGSTMSFASPYDTHASLKAAQCLTQYIATASWLAPAKAIARTQLQAELQRAEDMLERAKIEFPDPTHKMLQLKRSCVWHLIRELAAGIKDPIIRPVFSGEAPEHAPYHFIICAHRLLIPHIEGKPETLGLSCLRPKSLRAEPRITVAVAQAA